MSPQPTIGEAGISRTTPVEEAQLDWYREDPLANDHHHHWHIVYPPDGSAPGSGASPRTQARQGELFFYMHQQMLARYDTERRIAGLEQCRPLDDYDAPIEEGYELEGYGPRPSGSTLSSTGDLTQAHTEAVAALRSRRLELGNGESVPVDENLLGCIVESSFFYPNPEDPDPAPLPYSNFHGDGHVAIASISGQGRFSGPMRYVETAIRDPIFYRWHRHIDNLYLASQQWQEIEDRSQFAAEVEIGDGIALCLARDIPGAEDPDFDFEAWGRVNLGVDLDLGGPTTDELLTGFVTSNLVLTSPWADQPREWLSGVVHLTHEPFVHFIRAENLRSEPQDVTVRIFLAHAEFAEDRRLWIELDKFRTTLDPGPNLIARPDARSSVVKRKGLEVPGAERSASAADAADVWCDCGWPYSLLLPSGESTPEGTPFKLMVVITDWSKDHLGQPETCGSMSFCGARGEYPDARRMGYPFDRPFEGSIAETIASMPSMAVRDLRIRCTTQRPVGS